VTKLDPQTKDASYRTRTRQFLCLGLKVTRHVTTRDSQSVTVGARRTRPRRVAFARPLPLTVFSAKKAQTAVENRPGARSHGQVPIAGNA
jgi:hypothetical protein